MAILVGAVGLGLVVVTACSSTVTNNEGTPAAAANTPFAKPCTLDITAEPVQKEGYQRCSEVWAKEKNASKPCLDVATCEAAGGTCTVGNGGSLGDTRCYAVCNPAACPDGAGKCITCDGQPSHCEEKLEKCIPPPVPIVNGYGEPCDKVLPNGCTGPKDCCTDRWGLGSTCYQLMTLGKPNSLSKPSCAHNCKTNVDCDNLFGEGNGYCCLDVLATKPANSTMLEYTPVGQSDPLKKCVKKQFDSRCTRVPTSTGSSGSSGSSGTSGSSGCNYSSCMKACSEAGGTNCGEDCKC